MDISKLTKEIAAAQEEGISVDIKDPAGEDIGLRIVVAGPDSDRQKRARAALQNARVRSRQMTTSAAIMEAEAITLLSKATISWAWGKAADGTDASWGGQQLECTEENVASVYRAAPFIRDQVDAVAGSRGGFTRT